MKAFLTLVLGLTASGLFAQGSAFLYRSVPCQCPPGEVQIVQNLDYFKGSPVRSVVLKKTDRRRSFQDLTAREVRKLQRKARRSYCCEMHVYEKPLPSVRSTEEMIARQKAHYDKYIEVRFVQESVPCPECCPPEGSMGMR